MTLEEFKKDFPEPILNPAVALIHEADMNIVSRIISRMYIEHDSGSNSMILLDIEEIKLLSFPDITDTRYNKRFVHSAIKSLYRRWEKEYRRYRYTLGLYGKYKVCTIIGSARLKDGKLKAADEYERKGYIVLGARIFKKDQLDSHISKEELNDLQEKYFYEISLSDEVIIVTDNIDGNTGHRTTIEMNYAIEIGVPCVKYYYDLEKDCLTKIS